MPSKRRGKGEGTIRKRKDGRWEARVSLPDGQRRAAYGRTRESAAAELVKLLRDAQEGLNLAGNRSTVGAHLAGWLETMRTEVRPGSLRRYEEAIRLHLTPAIGAVPLVKLTPDHLRRLFGDLLAKGLSVGTVRRIRATLRAALQQAVRDGKVVRNVAALTRPPKAGQAGEAARMRTLTRDQAKALLRAAQGDRLEAVYVLALATGMRQGELLGLHWSDVDLRRGTLRVVGTLQRSAEGFSVAEPKTERGRREIDLTPEAVAALRRRKAVQGEERLRAGEVWQDTGLVFTTEIGTPIEKGNLLRRSFVPLLGRAGLAERVTTTETRTRRGKVVKVEVESWRPMIRFHDLRHTAATLLLEQGTHPSIVAALLGHSQASVTLNVYSHALPTIMRQAAKAMHEILS